MSTSWRATLSVTPEHLERQLGLLVKRGYRGVGFHQGVRERPTGKVVAVTFDDAYRSVLELAFPIMSRLGLPGTVFAVTRFVGGERPMSWPGIEQWLGTPDEPELRALSWDQLGTLAEAGWEIGSHTRSHPHLTSLDDPGLEAELTRSREECERGTGLPCRSIAYPYGDHDARVVAAAERAGYSAGGTLPARLHPASPLRWPRIGVYQGDGIGRFRLKVSPTVRALRGGRAWELVSALRG